MIEYMDWAKGQLDREPSVYDWDGMTLSEMAKRALALCSVARDKQLPGLESAFWHLEKMAEALEEKYPRRISAGWW